MCVTLGISIGITALDLIGEKRSSTFERNQAAGVSPVQLLLSNVIIKILIALPYCYIVTILPNLLYGLRTQGSIWLAASLVLGQNILGIAIGIFFASICKEIAMASTLSIGCLIISFFISGSMWPLESQPKYLKLLNYYEPTTLAVEAYRSIMYRGWDFSHRTIWMGTLINGAWSIVICLLGFCLFYR